MIYCEFVKDGDVYRCQQCGRRLGRLPAVLMPCKNQLPSDDDFVCVHRGETLSQKRCGGCGAADVMAGVYRCNLHGDRCSVRSWTTEARLRDRVCIDCPDYDG